MYQPITPLQPVALLVEMRAELLRVLESLSDAQWEQPSLCPGWSIRDVTRHLLADDVGLLSRFRDDDGVTFPTNDWAELVQLINAQNEAWISATRRISRRVLLSLLAFTGEQLWAHFAAQNLSEATRPIAWALDRPAPMWLRISRELTEYWMHHQHICEPLSIISLKDRRFLLAVLTTFVHALPTAYRDVAAADDTTLRLRLTGEADASFDLVRQASGWTLYASTPNTPTSTVTMADDTAWRLFTKGLPSAEAERRSHIDGDASLARPLFATVAIIA
jgi:uncharacterized protein (TIGR03083 family)